ncbi:hypothetical protein DLAC_08459 [Tieghemostelium lacteum]|uniref:AB hydrolase-1 domain-containing protein n=1 Tax=Tieghemostelium lacteum TaxID=361077 RepID=A0A151Z7F5_TIELA|nr:hypothetical protein DLAC_08459 [Tieghemostelium lacteum]|eukprot:KYQ89896.1 hypothetical protein DLAC_08459 [Tieghemostelium lacteum]
MISSSFLIRYEKTIIQRIRAYSSNNNVSFIKDKKILINGSDVSGLSLALFLKKKGVSCEVVESNKATLGNQSGIILNRNSLQLYRETLGETLYEKLQSHSIPLSGNVISAIDGEIYKFQDYLSDKKSVENVETLPLSMNEHSLKQLLLEECEKVVRGEGIVKMLKGFKLKSLQQSNDKPQQQVHVTFSNNSSLNIAYDLVIGSIAQRQDTLDQVREFLIDSGKVPLVDKYIKSSEIGSNIVSFSTVVPKTSTYPPIITTQSNYDCRLVSFLMPDNQISLRGSFRLPKQTLSKESDSKSLIFQQFNLFEDLNAHNIISFSDASHSDMIKLREYQPKSMENYYNGNICVIGDSADAFTLDTIYDTSVGIEDAKDLSECLLNVNNGTTISEKLMKYNESRKNRVDRKLKSFLNDEFSIFYLGNWKLSVFVKKRGFCLTLFTVIVLVLLSISIYGFRMNRDKFKLSNPDLSYTRQFNNATSHFPIINNRKLHIRCYQNEFNRSGNSKTVLFEAGIPFYSTVWGNVLVEMLNNSMVQNDIKQYCVYDRYGYGWSDFKDTQTSALDMVVDLKGYLTQLNITSNLVLVGWSYGGILSQMFSVTYPSMVDGLVLVDTMDVEDLQDSFLQSMIKTGVHSFSILKYLLVTGIVSLPLNYPLESGYMGEGIQLPSSLKISNNIFYSSYPTIETSIQELSVITESLNQLNHTMVKYQLSNQGSSQYLGSLPLVVLTAGQNGTPDWIQRQTIIASFSSSSIHIINNQTNHFVPLNAANSIVNSIQLCIALSTSK